MDNEPTSPSPRVRLHDLVVGALVAIVYAVIWFFLPTDWLPNHSGGKWFLALFIATSGLAAVLASVFLTTRSLRTKDHPAVWLGIQVIFWNPIAFRAVLALTEAAGLPSGSAGLVSVFALVLLGLPISLMGVAFSGSRMWTVAYLTRAAQCFVASWVPLLPPVLFLHVVLFAEAVNWDRYGLLHRCALALVLIEQVAAFLWAFMFSQMS